MKPIEINFLKSTLQSRLRELLQRLYPEKPAYQLHGGWRVGNHGSLSVSVEGVFYDHEAGVGGDLLDLIQHALRCDFLTALHWVQGFLGSVPVTMTRKEFSDTVKKDSGLRDRERMDKALQLWRKGMLPQGTLAETYLRNRGITIPLPFSCRYLPRAWNYTSGFHPALIAAVQNVEGKITAGQVIYLTESGHKIVGDKVQAKLCYGVIKGGAVRLSPLSSTLVLCEGIEDGLSILQSCPGCSVWATLGTSGLINVQIPDSVSDVVIACDNDKAGKEAARKLATCLMAEGKRVRLALPSIGKDFNEALQRGGVAYA